MAEIIRYIDEKELPGTSAINKYVKEQWEEIDRQYRSLTSLDHAWSVGDCLDHNLPPTALETVLSLQHRLARVDRYLTRRHVLWLGILHPILTHSLQDTYSDREQQEVALLQAVSLYSLRHQIIDLGNRSEIPNGPKPITTHDLDHLFVISRDVTFPTFLRAWLTAFSPSIAEDIEKDAHADQQHSGLDLDPETTLLGEFQRLLLDAITDSDKRQAVVDYVVEHPEVTPQAQEWLVFNLRRWLVKDWRARQKEKDDGQR
jgi:hypothetical protein